MKIPKPLLALALWFAAATAILATVPSSTTWVQYTLTTSPQALTVPFVFQSASDLLVLDSKASPPVTLTLNSDYSVAGGSGSTGTITTIAGGANAVAIGDRITISRRVPLTQTTTFTTGGPITPAIIGQSVDKLTTIAQQLNLVGANSLQFQGDEQISGVLPLNLRKNSFLSFDASGNPLFVPQASVIVTSTSPLSTLNFSSLRAVPIGTSTPNGTPISVDGGATQTDGLGGTFIYSAASTQADDNLDCIAASGGVGRWLRNQQLYTTGIGKFGVYCNDLSIPNGGPRNPYVEAQRMAALGISFVIYYSHAFGDPTRTASDLVSLDALAKAGIGAIVCPFGANDGTGWATYAANYVNVPNLIGWYVFDEPSGNGISVATQDSTIAAVKAVKNLPVYTADNAWSSTDFASTVSANYDALFPDIYLQTTSVTKNSASSLVVPTLTAFKNTFDRVSPVLGAYETSPANVRASEVYLNAWTYQLDFYKTKTTVFFIWNENPNYITPSGLVTINQNAVLFNAVRTFTREYRSNGRYAWVRVMPRPESSVGFGILDLRSAFVDVFGHYATTGTVRTYSGDGQVGLYLNNGQIAVIDMKEPRDVVTLQMKIKDDFGANAVSFDIIKPDDLTFTTGTVMATITADGSGSSLSYCQLTGYGGRYLMIKSNTPIGHNGFVYIYDGYFTAL